MFQSINVFNGKEILSFYPVLDFYFRKMGSWKSSLLPHKNQIVFPFREDSTLIRGLGEQLGLSSQGGFRPFISSPEPKAHGELIGHPCSGVRPASYVIHNFKHLLLQNRLPDQSQILC